MTPRPPGPQRCQGRLELYGLVCRCELLVRHDDDHEWRRDWKAKVSWAKFHRFGISKETRS